MIKKIHNNARTTEIGEIARQLVALYNRSESHIKDDAFLQGLFPQIEQQAHALTQAVNNGKVTSILEQSDAARTDSLRIINKLLAAYAVFPTDDIREKGKAVAKVFGRYGMKIIRQSYMSKSNLIDALLLDLSESNIGEAVAALQGLPSAIASLKKAQEEFKKVSATYYDQRALQSKQTPASELKKPLLQVINQKLMLYLASSSMVNASLYNSFHQAASEIIEQANTNIKQRQAKEREAKNSAEKQPTTPHNSPATAQGQG